MQKRIVDTKINNVELYNMETGYNLTRALKKALGDNEKQKLWTT